MDARPAVSCGIDWAERHHDVALVDDEGQLVPQAPHQRRRRWLATLVGLLAEAGDNQDHPIPVAIQTPRGLLVAALRATGRPVYAINPVGAESVIPRR